MNNIHPTAIVENGAQVDPTARVWHFCHLRENSIIESEVSLGRDVYVDKNVKVSRGSRVQNGVSLYEGLEIGPWCFIGPHAIFTNDQYPRSGKHQWEMKKTVLAAGMSIGAGCVVRCGITIGAFAMLGAGAIVVKDIAPFHLAIGMPAKETKVICACGNTQMPLGTLHPELVRDCCWASLKSEVIDLAISQANLYQPLPTE